MSKPKVKLVFTLFVVIICFALIDSNGKCEQPNENKSQSKLEDSDPDIVEALAEAKSLLDWKRFQARFNKGYSSVTEQLFRFKQFLARSLRAVASMAKYVRGKSRYYLTINKFSDRSPKELFQTYNVAPEEEERDSVFISTSSMSKRVKRATGVEIKPKNNGHGWFKRMFNSLGGNNKNLKPKKAIDWRESGCLNGPRWQGDCGSCYILVTLELLEWSHCRQWNGAKVKFSEQFVIDCGSRVGLGGCTSGTLKKTIDFINNHGLMLNKDRPYLAVEGQCPLDEVNSSLTLIRPERASYILHRTISEWNEQILEQPLVVCILMKDEFFDYGGGLLEADDCDLKADTRHYVTLVGMGVERGKEYWLMANNFGEDWGRGGYFKVEKKGSENCIIYMMSANADFQKNAIDVSIDQPSLE